MYPYDSPEPPQVPQATGAIVLTTAQLQEADFVIIINAGGGSTVTTLAALVDYFGAVAQVGLVATGNSQDTAIELTGSPSVFEVVAAGTGAIIPFGADAGTLWDVWNAGDNNLLVYPPSGSQIQNFGVNVPAAIVPGGRSTLVVGSTLTQIYAR